jgi:hypothetical protein
LIPRASLSATVGNGGESIPVPESKAQNPMKQTVTSYSFVDSFRAAGRESQFTRPALFALFDYLEEYENSCEVELELDPVAICCDWAEYPSALAAAKEYGFDEVCGDDADCEPEALEWLREQTQVVEFDGGVVVQMF